MIEDLLGELEVCEAPSKDPIQPIRIEYKALGFVVL